MGKHSSGRRKNIKVVEDKRESVNIMRTFIGQLIIICAVSLMIGIILAMGFYQNDKAIEEAKEKAYMKGQQDIVDNMYRSSGQCLEIELNGKYGIVKWLPASCCK